MFNVFVASSFRNFVSLKKFVSLRIGMQKKIPPATRRADYFIRAALRKLANGVMDTICRFRNRAYDLKDMRFNTVFGDIT